MEIPSHASLSWEIKQINNSLHQVCLPFPDFRFSPFFQGPSYFSTYRVVPVNTTIKTAKFHKDFNYDVVIDMALSSSIAIYARFVMYLQIC